jgi:hypothetical protein
MFGYILSGDSSQQKFFNIIGPRRSGKGTINKVLVSLLGQHNTVAPQLDELCDTFGLQPWLGKLLASFTDARAPERNRGAVVSQLLRIVGGDTVTVNRKNKEAWSGYLPTRIVIYSNEALQLERAVSNMTLVIFSDMQIDEADRNTLSLYDSIEKLYSTLGMEMYGKPLNPPHILFWNLKSTSGFPTLSTQPNVSSISGFSPALLNLFCEQGITALQACTPWSTLLKSLENPRYEVLESALKSHFDN